MAKDAYYFRHDSNAIDDPKCVLLIEQLGLEGYGIFWMLIEKLRDQPGYKYPVSLTSALARRYNTTPEKVKTVITNYQLFNFDGDYFYSESLIQRMKPLERQREIAILAGKASANKRLLNVGSTGVKQKPNGCSTSRVEYSREEKSREEKNKLNKKDIYGELKNVYLTKEEYEKLKERFNSDTENRINRLSTYIASKGDKYKSHYATILSWAQKDEKQKVIQKVNDGW